MNWYLWTCLPKRSDRKNKKKILQYLQTNELCNVPGGPGGPGSPVKIKKEMLQNCTVIIVCLFNSIEICRYFTTILAFMYYKNNTKTIRMSIFILQTCQPVNIITYLIRIFENFFEQIQTSRSLRKRTNQSQWNSCKS